MLERVPLLEKELADYEEVAGAEAIERIRALAEPFRGARILHINATAYGGGVAELLSTHVPLLRSLGIEAEWQVIHGSDEFFAVTKAVHNALQGADVPWTTQMQKVYLEKVLENALLLEGEWDYVVVHDPQPAALLTFIADSTREPTRDEVDLALPHRPHRRARRRVGVLPPVRRAPRRVGLDDGPVHPGVALDGQHHHGAAVHRSAVGEEPRPPRSVRARDLQAVRDRHEAPDRVPGQPVRPVEGPGRASSRRSRSVREQVPDAQLVLAGSMATDDPEGFHVWEQVEAARDGDRDIHLLSNIQQVGNVQINAFQRAADVVIQKSLREGFGLTVAEGLWKGRPVIGGRAGGIVLQIRDGQDGYLVDSVEECAARTIELLADPGQGRRDGGERQGARPAELPLDPRARGLARLCSASSASARLVIVVSNRGPFRFTREPDGTFSAQRGAGGVVSALLPLLASREDATWVAAAIGDDDAPRLLPARRLRSQVCTPGCCRWIRTSNACTATSSRTRRSGSCTTRSSTCRGARASTAGSARRGTGTSR